MNKIENMATQQCRGEEVEKALVLWNISNCPIPDGHDPLMVVQRIQTAVEKSGHVRRNGQISITAIGHNLTEIPGGEDVLRKLSSIGIHSHQYQDDLYQWADENPPPATMMLIDGHEQLGWLAFTLSDLEDEGYRILLAYTHRDLATPFPRAFSKQWDWDALVSDEQETTITTTTTTSLVCSQGNYNDQYGPFYCSVCFVDALSFEDFTAHLKSAEHEYGHEWDRYASKYNVDRRNPDNLPFGRSKELDLLLTQDMVRRQEMVSRKRLPGGFRPRSLYNSQSKD